MSRLFSCMDAQQPDTEMEGGVEERDVGLEDLPHPALRLIILRLGVLELPFLRMVSEQLYWLLGAATIFFSRDLTRENSDTNARGVLADLKALERGRGPGDQKSPATASPRWLHNPFSQCQSPGPDMPD